MARTFKPWAQRSATQVRRLERAGFTERSYAAATPAERRAAFSHGPGKTPEHGIGEALKNRGRYSNYLNRKGSPSASKTGEELDQSVMDNFDRVFPENTGSMTMNGEKIRTVTVERKRFLEGMQTNKGGKWTDEKKRVAANLTESEWRRLAARANLAKQGRGPESDEDAFSFLYYH
jgi:hypothetical protein